MMTYQPRARVIPCLLLKERGLVKTTQFKNPLYVGDPINAVKIFNEREVDELILLDIGASPKKTGPDFKKIHEVASECFVPFTYGGGVRTLEDAKQIFDLGAEKIALNSIIFENPSIIESIARVFGAQSVVISLDFKKNLWGNHILFTNSGQKKIDRELIPFIKELESRGAGEILVTSIDKEGTMKGMELGLVETIASSTRLPVIAHGGAGSLTDMGAIIKQGRASAAAAGSLFIYHGKHKAVLINYPSNEELQKALVL